MGAGIIALGHDDIDAGGNGSGNVVGATNERKGGHALGFSGLDDRCGRANAAREHIHRRR